MTHNYCRNTGSNPGLWCYTINPDVKFEWCNPIGDCEWITNPVKIHAKKECNNEYLLEEISGNHSPQMCDQKCIEKGPECV